MGEQQDRNSAGAARHILTDPGFLQELEAIIPGSGKKPEKAQAYAQKCLKEIAATPSDSAFRPAARMARFIYTRSYESELDINSEALEQLRARGAFAGAPIF